MTEDEFWSWVEGDPKAVGAALLVTLDALKEGVELEEGPAYLPRPRDIEMEKSMWAKGARKVLDVFGTT